MHPHLKLHDLPVVVATEILAARVSAVASVAIAATRDNAAGVIVTDVAIPNAHFAVVDAQVMPPTKTRAIAAVVIDSIVVAEAVAAIVVVVAMRILVLIGQAKQEGSAALIAVVVIIRHPRTTRVATKDLALVVFDDGNRRTLVVTFVVEGRRAPAVFASAVAELPFLVGSADPRVDRDAILIGDDLRAWKGHRQTDRLPTQRRAYLKLLPLGSIAHRASMIGVTDGLVVAQLKAFGELQRAADRQVTADTV